MGIAERHVDDEMGKPANRMSAPHVRDATEDRIAERRLRDGECALSHLEQELEA
jgi:hypothetical protein